MPGLGGSTYTPPLPQNQNGGMVNQGTYGANGTHTPAAGSSGGGAGMPSALAPPTPLPAMTNTVAMDPRLDRLGQRMEDRLNNPNAGTGRAIDRSTSAIRDAAEGRRKAISERFGARDAFGSGGHIAAEMGIEGQVGADIAKAASGIAVDAERHEDSMLLGSVGALGAAGDAAARDRQIAISQWSAQQNAQQGARAQQLAEAVAISNMLSQITGSGGGYGAPPPPPRPTGGAVFR